MTLTNDLQAFLQALVVGCIIGFVGGGLSLVLRSTVRSPRKSL